MNLQKRTVLLFAWALFSIAGLGLAVAQTPLAREDVSGVQRFGVGRCKLSIALAPPPGHHFTEGAPFEFHWGSSSENLRFLSQKNLSPNRLNKGISVSFESKPGDFYLNLKGRVFFCKEGSEICKMQPLELKIPVSISDAEVARKRKLEWTIQVQPGLK